MLVIVYRAPRSFTGEEAAEICTHGSPLIVSRVLDVLDRAGFRPAGPGEFTLRAFLNGRLDLTQAEAVNELVRARTDRARALALHRLAGSIEGRILALKKRLLSLQAAVEVRLDYPEEDLPGELAPSAELDGLEAELAELAASYRIGRLYQEGVSAVLAGRTNSGKSTLFNRLLREERAIVSETPGTTRDYLEGGIELEGVPVRLFDTAGYRAAGDAVEREGQRRTDALVDGAQLVLYLVDSGDGLRAEDRRFLEEHAGQAGLMPLWAKADLPGAAAGQEVLPGFLRVSGVTGEGIGELAREMGRRILAGAGPAAGEAAVIDSLRQKELLDRALACLPRVPSGPGRRVEPGPAGRGPARGPGRPWARSPARWPPRTSSRRSSRVSAWASSRRAMGDFEAIVIGGGHAGIEAASAWPAWASPPCWSPRAWTPSAGCPATRPSAGWPRATWCGRSTPWAARWAASSTAR